MHIEIHGTKVTVKDVVGMFQRPQKFPSESALWRTLQTELNAWHQAPDGQPFDLVKKIMASDGHMVGDDHGPYYLRDRKWRWCIYDPGYAIGDLAKDFNKVGEVQLVLHHFNDDVVEPIKE